MLSTTRLIKKGGKLQHPKRLILYTGKKITSWTKVPDAYCLQLNYLSYGKSTRYLPPLLFQLRNLLSLPMQEESKNQLDIAAPRELCA